MTNLTTRFYSVLKNEDAVPYVGGNVLVVADGLGGSGSAVHKIDREKHKNMRSDIMSGAFFDIQCFSNELAPYIEELLAPMSDGEDDTSALWASRVVIARCVYALTEGEFKDAELKDEKVRAKLAEFIGAGLKELAKKFNLQKGKYDDQLLLPTTLAFIRYSETKSSVIAETVWAGDSRCYALTLNGMKALSVDDEDDSGVITNLFYVGDKKIKLNYLRHEMDKPCALFAVSDGVFDPFSPHESFGVENLLLSTISECDSVEELAVKLKETYDGIHGDDSTMAFVPVGFSDYADMKKQLARRTERVVPLRRKQLQCSAELAVMNESEEDASHYVLGRTRDKYEQIASMLVEAADCDIEDIACSPLIKKTIESVKARNVKAAEELKWQKTERALIDLYNFVKGNPERVATEVFTRDAITFIDKSLYNDYSDFLKATQDMMAYVGEGKHLETYKKELDDRKREQHLRAVERIKYYREQYDALWDMSAIDVEATRKRGRVYRILSAWSAVDNALLYDWGLGNLSDIPVEERGLADEMQQRLSDYKAWREKVNSMKKTSTVLANKYVNAWNRLFERIRNDNDLILTFLSGDAVLKFGFCVVDETDEARAERAVKEKILAELAAQKDAVVADIVKSLAQNFDKISAIDGLYNATKLELFRTYYRLKSNPDESLKLLEAQIESLEKAYESLLKK